MRPAISAILIALATLASRAMAQETKASIAPVGAPSSAPGSGATGSSGGSQSSNPDSADAPPDTPPAKPWTGALSAEDEALVRELALVEKVELLTNLDLFEGKDEDATREPSRQP